MRIVFAVDSATLFSFAGLVIVKSGSSGEQMYSEEEGASGGQLE